MKRIAIVPARGGSKRIPQKNIREFLGKPAITMTLETLKLSSLFDSIFVSTDSKDIAEIALDVEGVEVFMRSPHLADDLTPTVPVVADAIRQFIENSNSSDAEILVCCVYPVNPFLLAQDLQNGLAILQNTDGISYVNSIVSYAYPIQRAVSKDANGRIEMLNPSLALTRSQDLEETFHDAGQWYWGRANTWLSQEKLLSNAIGVQIPRWRAQDIDTEEDWQMAEKLFKLE